MQTKTCVGIPCRKTKQKRMRRDIIYTTYAQAYDIEKKKMRRHTMYIKNRKNAYGYRIEKKMRRDTIQKKKQKHAQGYNLEQKCVWIPSRQKCGVIQYITNNRKTIRMNIISITNAYGYHLRKK